MRQEGELVDLPRELLRLQCASYRVPRRAKWCEAVSDELDVNGTLAAGCSRATGLAKVFIHRALQVLAQQCPLVRYQNAVDDAMVQAAGKTEEVRRQSPAAVPHLANMLAAKDPGGSPAQDQVHGGR